MTAFQTNLGTFFEEFFWPAVVVSGLLRIDPAVFRHTDG
jgi:hypothetical protein